jgi:dTMP kinase
MLVCVVGTDGAGKSTVTKAIARQLAGQGERIQRVDRWDIVANQSYPAARFMRPDIPDARLCIADMPNPPRFLFLMWSIGMALLGRRDVLEPADVTLMDGYWMKHAASEVVYGLPRPWVEAVAAGLPRPDVVIYLRLDPATAWQRRQRRDIVPYECGMDPACGYEQFIAHQGKIRAVLDAWSARDAWIEIDAAAPQAEVEAAVLRSLTGARPITKLGSRTAQRHPSSA